MGWLWLAVIGGAAFAALRLAGMRREIGWFAVAALMLGATGYATQQHAVLPGRPTAAGAERVDVDPGQAAFRSAIMPGASGDARVLAAADNRLRAGDTRAAAQEVLDAIAGDPGDAALWAGLGSVLSAHDGGQVSPAVQFAFARAFRLAPEEPGPPFFLGLAFLQAGELPAAKAAWLQALKRTPRDSALRLDLAERLVLLDEFQAMAARGRPPGR